MPMPIVDRKWTTGLSAQCAKWLEPATEKILQMVSAEGEREVGGLLGSSRSWLVAAATVLSGRHCLAITRTQEIAEDVAGEIRTFLPPESDVMVFSELSPVYPAREPSAAAERCDEADSTAGPSPSFPLIEEDRRIVERLASLVRFLQPSPRFGGAVIVSPIRALLQQVPEPSVLRESLFTIEEGGRTSMAAVVALLAHKGFERLGRVEAPGQFALRGGILDVFSYSDTRPARIEFTGDTVESIRLFDPDTQASLQTKRSYETFLVSRAELLGGTSPKDTTVSAGSLVTRYFPPSSWVAFFEKAELLEHARRILAHEEDLQGEMKVLAFLDSFRAFPAVSLSTLPVTVCEPRGDTLAAVNLRTATVQRLSGDLNALGAELASLAAGGGQVFVVCENTAVAERFTEVLENAECGMRDAECSAGFQPALRAATVESQPPAYMVVPVIGRLTQGFSLPEARVTVLPHNEVFNRYRFRRQPRDSRAGRTIDDFLTFKKGDLVVHQEHGIGRYLGVQKLKREGGCLHDFLVVEYDGHEKLFVPVYQADIVQRYVGAGSFESELSLAKLGSALWGGKKARVSAALERFALELLEIQAAREREKGIAYPRDARWQHEFEAAFPFEDTEDQVLVTAELKKDMESPRPMDRLICGDVGYGKTELAMRAAFKVATFGKQTAVLVPTTVLAQQHYINFRDRMAQFPIVIDVLSRFRSKNEQADVLRRLRAGSVDVIIGTHRLIQKDVVFKDLGLVVIDEEQRFGVEHKETLKRLRSTVDVLTLTATPIPRTLHMSLLGLRDISTLSTPPQDRRAIVTEVCPFDGRKIRQAILSELDRGGQVFFLHNRVFDIEGVAQRLGSIVPEARLSVAHGQMSEHLLEKRMLAFIEGRSDVLVTTTIIESGLDIPNANTIFVHNADMFGLADLHQLRGRVGRYKNQAFAYFLLPEGRPPVPDAVRRLRAIQEFDELGAGFKIAMRDLEIRGAGNLLGREQSGHIAAVGYELYCRLLDTAIKKVKNEKPQEQVEACVDLRVDAFLPDSYVADENGRIEAYRAISRLPDEKDIRLVEASLVDRYGPIDSSAQPVRNLLEIAALRAMAHKKGIALIAEGEEMLTFKFKSPAACEAFRIAHQRQVRSVDRLTLVIPLAPVRRGRRREVVKLLRGMLG